ncbi:MAG: DUF1588 domain-containing protein [Rhodospirillaceae bacterium]|nr:DUF1588 domain-containing protein [Rhodospirillaceae bacterium]
MNFVSVRSIALSTAGVIAAVSLAACSGKTETASAKPQAVAAASAPATAEPQLTKAPARVRVLTQDQYFNSLAYVFGPDARIDARFPPFRRTDGLLALGAAAAGVTASGVEKFQHAAQLIAAQVVDVRHRDFLVPCKPKSVMEADPACAAQFISATARLLYRAPMAPEKLATTVAAANEAAGKVHDFYRGLSFALEGVLLDPNFIFAAETGQPDPGNPGRLRLDPHSAATRLSLFLWNQLPDDTLLKAADRGDLNTKAGRAKIVDAMLANPRIEEGTRAFFSDMLGFDDFDSLSKDPMAYASFTGATAIDAREQTLRVIVDQLIKKDGDYRDLFTTRTTFLSPALAAVYRVPSAPGWVQTEFPEGSQRSGLLSQVSFLALHAHPARSSPTRRGKAVREQILCQKVPEPPANVDFSIVEDPKAVYHTARERVTAHLVNPVCAGCHKITDPIGLALENFDGAGQYRETEKGAAIDASGSLDGKPFKDAAGLGQALHDSPALTACVVRRAFSYGVGSPDTGGRDELMAYYNKAFSAQGYKFKGLLRNIALSDAFYTVTEK